MTSTDRGAATDAGNDTTSTVVIMIRKSRNRLWFLT